MSQKQQKPDNSRLNIFYILYVLKNNTDEEHPLSASEITRIINTEFGYLSSTGKIISPDTVKRTLDEFLDKLFPKGMDKIRSREKYGYAVYCVMKAGSRYIDYEYDYDDEKGTPPKRYYYYESDFTLAEIKTLKDAMETYNYFSEEDITEIITKLMRIRPKSFPNAKYFDVAGENREEDSLLLMNIDLLNEIINRRNYAKITYCAYDINKKLVPRPGYPKIFEPIHLMWSNGYYYLLVYNEKYSNFVSLRVDRITDIKEVEVDNSHRLDEFNPVRYRYEHPVMYGGEKKRMVLLCRDTGKNYIMNTIVDVFGKTAKVTKADDKTVLKYLGHDTAYYKEQGITWLRVSIDTTTGGVELWATQYCYDCLIISPEESAIRVKERIEAGLQYYNYTDKM